MPPNSSIPFRAALDVLRPVRPRPLCKCLNSQSLRYKGPSASTSRYVSTASPDLSEMEVDAQSSPRWSQTPPLMKAPVQSRLPKPDLTPLVCNSDPRKLDDMYTRFLGKGGDKLLSEEVKWLAVTAKSFDHGRRGFNDRLAFLGKRIIELQCSLGLLSMSGDATHYLKEEQHDPLGREHFKHPATNAVEVIAGGSRKHYTHYKYLANVATQHGIPDVVRWHPRMPDNLSASGSDVIYAQALAAIVGALALEQGSAVANRIAKERVLMLGTRKYVKQGNETD